MLDRHRRWLFSGLGWTLLGLALAIPAAAASPTREAGATLLIPYFEVDLDQPDGLTTLFSVSNLGAGSNSGIVAHGVLWSDWGLPVYSWDFYLAPGDSQSYNLRDLLSYGTFPATHPPADFGRQCARPIMPAVAPEPLGALQRQLTGRPDPEGGLCSSEPRADASIATGSITIDVMRACTSGGIDDPFDIGYLAGPGALAASTEALAGDFFLVDPAADLAEGFEAYPLRRGASSGDSFWEGGERSDLRREPLSTAWRLRFLQGGPFAARTSVFVYHRRAGPVAPGPCEAAASSPHGTWSFDVYDPAGDRVIEDLRVPDQSRRTAARLELALPAELLSGTLRFRALITSGAEPSAIVEGQSLLFGAIEARGRFGVGIFGTPLN